MRGCWKSRAVSLSLSVLGQMAPTAPELAARPIRCYLWSLIKFPFLKVTLFSGVSGGAAEIPATIHLGGFSHLK